MSGEDGAFVDVAIQHGFDINVYNGAYIRGKQYDMSKKLEVAAAITEARRSCMAGGSSPNITAIQRQCKVGWSFVKKIEKELDDYGRVLAPSEMQRKTENAGPGSKTLDEMDVFVLLLLYIEEPSRGLPSYVAQLKYLAGTIVSRSTISRFFKEQFPYSATFHRPNLIPFDKFRTDNCIRAIEYVSILAKVNPKRLKFGDEKSMKGKEVFKRKVRRNPLTGEIPPLLTTPDFTNTYSLTGFCGIDERSTAVWCSIHDDTNDAVEFALQIELAISTGFFHPGDVLVLDNAAIHVGGENTVLEEYLWEHHGILVLFLPPRSPEWNPMELVWNTTVGRLKLVPLAVLYEIGSHSSAVAAREILSRITHQDVRNFYKKCNVL